MKQRIMFALACAIICSLLVPWATTTPTHAQEATPAVGAGAAQFLPGAESFGEGWTTLPPAAISNLSTNVFKEAAVGYYGGPDGARAAVMVFLITDARVATRQAWDEVSARYDTFRYALTTDSNRDFELATIPPPAACEEVKRAEGTDSFAFPTAITLCAGSNNVIVLAMVSGGEAATVRYQAADALVTAAMQRGTPAKG
jgi:hypothetical protein